MDKSEYKSESLDHLGLVSGMYDELGIGQLVDKLIEQFFETKAVARLMGAGVKASYLNDDALGKALDAFHGYGVTELYSKLAVKAARRLGLKPKTGHLDSTSLHVDGNYNHEDIGLDEVEVIRITQGYSRDHRADLNQTVLDLMVEHQAGIPLLMQAASGNKSDKEGFKDIVDNHIAQLQKDYGITTIVLDSAGFTEKTIQAQQAKKSFWVAAVPANVGLAKQVLASADISDMQPLTAGYLYQE